MEPYIRPYVMERTVNPGCGVVQGDTSERHAKTPEAGGAGDFLGVYGFASNVPDKTTGEHAGITVMGLTKARAGGVVTAGKYAVLTADTSGRFVNCPTAAGTYNTCGIFLETGQADEFVDLLVMRQQIIIE